MGTEDRGTRHTRGRKRQGEASPRPSSGSRLPVTLAVLAAVLAIGGLILWRGSSPPTPDTPAATAGPALEYVGTTTCRTCHADQATDWDRSQHAAAIAEATEASVLGRFDDTTFTHRGVTSTFFRRDGRYFVRTDGADGALTDFEIAYTFGVDPLQQYLIRFPGGRMQALSIAWDSRPAADGGQRWFHLYPHETIPHDDPLHWTGLQQNWNFMCADCHSTNLRKGYDEATRTFDTTWSEISVGCESCHGPGSRHLDLARGNRLTATDTGLTARLDERAGVTWAFDTAAGVPRRSQARTTNREIEVCARCHSRRAQITDDWHAGQPFENGFRPTVLETLLYHADGQQLDEVYTIGSFTQSRMHAVGVTCSDCHNPHSGQLRVPGNGTCTQCHQSSAYDSPAHHFHRAGPAPAACTSCHMPTTTYMVVDPRHDHSFRVPRPDQTVTLGVPNPCSACHTREGAAWAAAAIERHLGRAPRGFQTFASTFTAADRRAPASADLARLAADTAQPDIVRASALQRLASAAGADRFLSIDALMRHADPMVRRTALEVVRNHDAATRLRLAAPLLTDPIRTVRSEAVRTLVDIADQQLPLTHRAAFDLAYAELVAEFRFNADRPEAQTGLGALLLARGRVTESEAALREALRLDRTFSAAWVNLSDVARQRRDDAASERTLREAVALLPRDAAIRHALGLALVRLKRTPEAIGELRMAADMAPEVARYDYVLGVALNDTGRSAEALTRLRAAHDRHPSDTDILYALALYARRAGLDDETRRYTDRLATLEPGHPAINELRASGNR